MARADFGGRVRKVREALRAARVDAMLVSNMNNIRYLSGFSGSSAYLLITAGNKFFLTDSRYASQSRDEVKGFRVKIYTKALDAITGVVTAEKVGSLAFESDFVAHDAFLRLKKQLPSIKLKPLPGVAGKARVCKDAFELERIRESARLLDTGFEVAARVIRAGVTEKKAASIIESAFREAGADGLAFDTIVASGERAALPHGKASDRKIRKGDLVVVDMGVILNGYNSDGTRTYCVGRPSTEQKKVYNTVLDAQRRATERVSAGVLAAYVDAGARETIDRAGYGKYFGHGTGHGVGLDVHEAPSVSPTSKDMLAPGMVITVEPGIYIPGWGGVRIEDMVMVKRDGFEVLTATSKELVSL